MKEFDPTQNPQEIFKSNEYLGNVERLSVLDHMDALVRKDVFDMIRTAGVGHFGASYSSTEILTSLYFGGHLEWRSGNDRDRLILSNGHAVATLYSIFSYLGIIDREELKNFRKYGSALNAHPCAYLTPGIEASTGSLGQGLGRAIGMSLADKLDGLERHTYVIFGDGEAQEGQMLETASLAPKLGVDNLIAVVDKNNLQLSGPTSLHNQLDDDHFWKSLGWNMITINGHDHTELDQAFNTAKSNHHSPTIIVANTIMGKGLSFMEEDSLKGNSHWHHGTPTATQYQEGEKELEEKIDSTFKTLTTSNINLNSTNLFTLATDRLISLPNFTDARMVATKSEVPKIRRGEFRIDRETPSNTTRAFVESLISLAYANKNIVLLCADLAGSKSLGIYKFREIFPDRFIDVGIREQSLANIAGGLASSGFRPVIVVYDAMVNLMAEQIRFISQDNLPVLIWGAVGGTASAMGGRSHQSSYEPSLYTQIPGMAYFEPCDSNETYELLQCSLNHKGPSYFRTSRFPHPLVDRGHNPEPEKGAYIMGNFQDSAKNSNPDVLMLATGAVIYNATEAAKTLADSKISTRLINITRLETNLLNKNLKPLIVESVPIVTIHDANKTILSNITSGVITKKPSSKNELLALGIDGWGATNGDNDYEATMKDSGLDPTGIYASIRSWLAT